MNRIIEHTADGSATLYVPELNEHYHSVKGALTESRHIFIDMGLKASAAPEPRILEIGFGTGLNALLTLIEAEQSGKQVHYTGIELYPLPWETIEQLHYNDEQLMVNSEQAAAWLKALHTATWEEDVVITPHFTLRKVQADFANNDRFGNGERSPLIINRYSLIYFDAFAPEKQPEMWSQELFNRLYVIMEPDGILTTYCAKGVVRRMLQSAGFTVERLPGPPGGKREILRAKASPPQPPSPIGRGK
ncbi:tRNA (5-methylaminomethyl-2-thiouridine)(34)-methyltransferase MnmD [Bacteroides sp.]